MAIFDFLRKKKPEDEFMGMGPMPAGYGPAGPPNPMGGGFPQMGAPPGAGFPPMEGMPGMPQEMMGSPQGFAPQQGQQPDMETIRRTIETVNYKLDSLKAALDAINARLANIESAMRTTPGQQGGFY